MTIGALSARSYLVGCAVLVAMFGPLAVGAVRWRRRLLPDWHGIRGRIVELVLAASASVVVAELLGSFGEFRRWSILSACVVVGGTAAIAARPGAVPIDVRRHISAEIVIVVIVVAVVVAHWTVPVLQALRLGLLDSDTQTYHLPHAAKFFQDGWLTRLHYATVDDAIPYHPQNGELFHAYGMLAFGRDILSPFINMGWLAGTLGAAWTIGKRLGSGALSVAAVAGVLATPLMSTSQGGAAMTDVVSIFFLLAAVALLVHADGRNELVALAGLAAGMAVGTKLTIVVPVAALTVAGVIIAPSLSVSRARFVGLWLAPLALSGAFWYGRNAVRAANPVPALGLHLGPWTVHRIPMLLIDRYGYTFADYVFDGTVWRRFFLPGLDMAFGPAWAVVVIAPIVVLIVLVVRGRTPLMRGVGAAGLAGLVGYALTPTTALGLPHRPGLFAANLRYATPALALGLVFAPGIVPAERRLRWLATGVLLLPLAAGLGRDWEHRVALAVAVGIVAGAAALAAAVLPRVSGPRLALGFTISIAAVVVVGYGLQRSYAVNRYRSAEYRSAPDDAAFAWAQGVHDARIGMAGFFVSYPLYGADLSNRVDYLGDLRPDGAFTDYRRCSDWREAVNRGRYRYIVTIPPFPVLPEPPMARWTRSDPHAREILRHGRESVFRIDRPLDPRGCSS